MDEWANDTVNGSGMRTMMTSNLMNPEESHVWLGLTAGVHSFQLNAKLSLN